MKKIVVYFHGFGSSAQNDKVQQLRDAGIETYSWDIDINPVVSLPELGDKIDDMLMDEPHEPARIFFVGTSQPRTKVASRQLQRGFKDRTLCPPCV